MPRLERLRQEYETQGFDFRIVYVREAHPGENFPHHTSVEQKVRHAVALRDLEGVGIRILVDSLDGATHEAYGMRPNMIYLIDREGTVVYKSNWTDSAELKDLCESLLRYEGMRARSMPIVRKAFSERVHWIDMDPTVRERVYKRSGEKAIKDFVAARGYLPHATDAERGESVEVPGCAVPDEVVESLLEHKASQGPFNK